MKVRCVYGKSKFLEKGKIYEVLEEGKESYKIIDEDGAEAQFYKYKFEEVKEMKELTFKEVISNIKAGEVWESSCKRITGISDDHIRIESTIKASFGTIVEINNTNLYRLKRKEYTFEEVFKAYEEGKEIESVLSGYRYKKENGEDVAILSADWQEFDYFELYISAKIIL